MEILQNFVAFSEYMNFKSLKSLFSTKKDTSKFQNPADNIFAATVQRTNAERIAQWIRALLRA